MTETLKSLDLSQLKPIFPGDAEHLPNVSVRLENGRAMSTRQARRAMKALDQPRQAADQIGHLPEPGESLHLVLHGSYPLAAFVPAFVALAGEPIEELHITTLSFSEANIALFDRMVTAGQIKRMAIICSNFFAAEGLDKRIYDTGAAFCQRHGFRIAAVRNHSKIMLYKFASRRFVVASSANLRSATNIETAEVYQSESLYEFHRAWIEELMTKRATA